MYAYFHANVSMYLYVGINVCMWMGGYVHVLNNTVLKLFACTRANVNASMVTFVQVSARRFMRPSVVFEAHGLWRMLDSHVVVLHQWWLKEQVYHACLQYGPTSCLTDSHGASK